MIHNKLLYHKVCMFLQQFIFFRILTTEIIQHWTKNYVKYDSLQNFNILKKK